MATPPGPVRGAGTGISIATGSSAIHDHGAEKALYTVDLEGFVARHGWQQGSLVEVWRTFYYDTGYDTGGVNPRPDAWLSILNAHPHLHAISSLGTFDRQDLLLFIPL